jgi:hypothetical protein
MSSVYDRDWYNEFKTIISLFHTISLPHNAQAIAYIE